MANYTHLHVHTQYSILDGASNISALLDRAKDLGMTTLAITDHGNMFGVKEFHNEATKKGIKPILGCEVYVASKTRHDKAESEDRAGYHLILLAKNLTGYKNLIKLVSLGWIEGHYYKPRIDRELLELYHDGIIASSACLAGEIAQAILSNNITKAEEAALWYKNLFGEDYYFELMRHKTGNPVIDNDTLKLQETVNKGLSELGQKLGIKLIATNDSHFIRATDAEAHDRLICINTGKLLSDPDRLHYTKQEYLKTYEEMSALFADHPDAIANTMEIADKIEEYKLNHAPILPDFPLPEGFEKAEEYLHHLTYEGARARYPEVTEAVKERIDFELSVVNRMGFAGYFLIVQDFIRAAREMGVSVGPGRGSAAGSVVAFCLRITDIEPMKYDLLFERFLNPDRISMPDIDIDFDEDGRDDVIKWVVEKYGKDRVAQIVTYGTMAAKMAIKDVARVENLPLSEADRLSKMIPERPGITLKKAFKEVKELEDSKSSSNKLISQTLKYAEELEGSVRHTGLHACGVIIGKGNLIDYLPLCVSKDSPLLVTQYEGNQVESVGMLKMDFLGLKTLSIIKDALANIKHSKGEALDLDNIPFDDALTYELFSKGNTTGIFQFESDGMKKHLKDLKPNRFEDLIAMNALYRPGPMEYIPSYIRRKHGKEVITYDHVLMEEYLKDTYGITVYQEQVMQLSRSMAGFTRGQADSLRKAMGKKIKAMMDSLREEFIKGCGANGIEEKVAVKVWHDWEAFAEYAFNKSHSTCYAYTSYRMAYLKAHYPAEFMAAVLSRNFSDIKKVTFFIDECHKQCIPVLGPDVNESELRFIVNKKGEIRFGLAAIKGLGEAAVENIVSERNKNGNYVSIFDFLKRVNLRAVNRRSIEALAYAGAFDGFEGTHRAQYFYKDNSEDSTFIEKLVRHITISQSRVNEQQHSLFGDSDDVRIEDPPMPVCEEWTRLEQLKNENDVIGFYMSGHPLDDYKVELNSFCSVTVSKLAEDLKVFKGRDVTFGGMVTAAAHKTTKMGKPFGTMTIEDYHGALNLMFFSEAYLKMRHLMDVGRFLLVRGKIEARYGRDDEVEVKVQNMELLSEILDKLTRNITINLPLNTIDDKMADNINALVVAHPGKCSLRFRIMDAENNFSIEMMTKKYKVSGSEFLKSLMANEIGFKLN